MDVAKLSAGGRMSTQRATRRNAGDVFLDVFRTGEDRQCEETRIARFPCLKQRGR